VKTLIMLVLTAPLAIAAVRFAGQNLGRAKHCVAEQVPRWNEVVRVRGQQRRRGGRHSRMHSSSLQDIRNITPITRTPVWP
jgi:hypothetical protein